MSWSFIAMLIAFGVIASSVIRSIAKWQESARAQGPAPARHPSRSAQPLWSGDDDDEAKSAEWDEEPEYDYASDEYGSDGRGRDERASDGSGGEDGRRVRQEGSLREEAEGRFNRGREAVSGRRESVSAGFPVTRAALTQALVLREVLGKPRAKQPWRPTGRR